jgi:hypothetical protein
VIARRKVPDKATMVGPSAVVETVLWEGLPNLVMHCTAQVYADGEPREVGWLQVTAKRGIWQVSALDPDARARLDAEAEYLDEALRLLNMLLGDAETAWTPCPWMRSKAPRKARKGS